jgi:hypothetical protein
MAGAAGYIVPHKLHVLVCTKYLLEGTNVSTRGQTHLNSYCDLMSVQKHCICERGRTKISISVRFPKSH